MEHFPAPLTTEQSAALIARNEESFDVHGFGLWAVELSPATHSAAAELTRGYEHPGASRRP